MPRRRSREERPAPNVSWSEERGAYQLNLRDQRLTGGRVSLSVATDDPDKARTRRHAFFTMLDAGRYGAIASLRAGKVQWSDVERAVRTGDWDALRRSSARSETVAVAAKAWLKEVKRSGARASTTAKYASIVKGLKVALGADTTLDAVTTDDIRTWLAAPRPRTQRPWSPNAQILARSAAKQLFDFAIQRERERAVRGEVPALEANPVDAVPATKKEATRVEFLRPEEWLRIEEVAAGTPELGLLAVGALAGLRAGEAVHLRLGTDIDWDGNRIRVQSRAGDWPWWPKTANSVRDVPMGPRLRAILEAHVAAGYAGSVYAFIRAKRDHPMAMSTMRDLTRQTFGAARIRYGQKKDALTYHSLRHTFASWLVQRDVQLMKVARLLGDTVEMVASTYAHLLPSDLDRAVGLIDDTLSGYK